MASDDDLQSCLNYRFNDRGLLDRALTHRSRSSDNYERLEFLGDSVLGFVVSEWLYHRFPEVSEGKLTRMRSTVVRRETLAAVARSLGLSSVLKLGEGELKSGGFNRDSTLADSLEAVIGAIFLDGGLAASKQFILTNFGEWFAALNPSTVTKDPKSRLQEFLQGRGLPAPTYSVVSTRGEPHRQMFEVACHVHGIPQAFIAVGTSRRAAEQAAAKKAFDSLAGQ